MQICKKPKITRKKAFIAIFTVLILAVLWVLNNKWLCITEYEYTNKKIPDGLDGLKIVQISDLHNATFGKNNARLIADIKACEPDIIVITGDIADSNYPDIGVAVNFCEQAAKICPTYYVTGNHELDLDDDLYTELSDGIEGSGAVFLRDEAINFGTGENSFTIIGMNDESLDSEHISKVMENVPEDEFTLLLAHEPEDFEDFCTCKPDLILSGHAHGGLIRLPFIGGIVAPDQGFFPKYTAGRFDSGDTTMFISRGLGNSVVPLRFLNRPEIVCITLKKG